MIDLSVLIPAREEEFLDRTILECLKSIQGNTEIIVILDGYIPNPALTANDPRITIIYNPESKGQRAATNQAAKIAKGKYLMKLDAHCALDPGFDVKMLEAFKKTGDNTTMIPVMKNLHVYDWVCPNGHRWYQGKLSVCELCGEDATKEILWQVKPSPARFTFTFDKTMHFQYWGELAKRPENVAGGQLRETLSIQGSCFMVTKERYFALDLCSEQFHSWGQQGVEIVCKTWLSGGKVIANLDTYYAHLFRTNNFGGFPYENPESLINENRELSRELFQRNKWPLAIHSFEWLLEKFRPVLDWHDKAKKGIIYYSDSELDENIAKPVRAQLDKISREKQIPITTATLKELTGFGSKNIRFPSLKRSPASMFKQILGALENSTADIIFFCEHDVLYHSSHFNFTPENERTFYFNNNVWKVDFKTKKALKVDICEQLSGMCVYKETALAYVREKLKQLESTGFDGHYEPRGIRGSFLSDEPNIDIRHDQNLTPNRWSKDQFRNQENTVGWTEGICPDWAKNLF